MKTVLVSGASIAGPTLAYWLGHYGFDVTIVERAPAIRTGGYAIDVRGAALSVLDRMGALEEVRQRGTDTIGTSFVNARGKRVVTMERGFGVIDACDVEIMRGDLAELLYHRTRDTTEYLFGDSIRSLDERDDGVHVTFEHADPRVFDMVIGADGLHSNVRRLVFGDEARFLRHLGSYMAIFTAPNTLDLDRWQLMQNRPGKVVSIKTARGNRDVKVTAFFSSPKFEYDHRDVERQREIVAHAFRGDGWEIPRLLEAMRVAPDFYFDSTSQVQMDRWSRGRVALVGDACGCPSPLTGQGSSLALVGAYVLAGEIAAAHGEHTAAFARYEETLREFVARNQKAASDVARNFTGTSALGVWWRDLNFRLMQFLPWGEWMFKLFMREIADAAKAVRIDDYAVPAETRSRSGRAHRLGSDTTAREALSDP